MRNRVRDADLSGAEPDARAASQFAPGLKPSYRIREFTGAYLHFHGFAAPLGESATTMKLSVTMDSTNRHNAKLLAAVIGGSAVVTMGALAMGNHQQPTGTENVAVGRMTMAATTTASGKDDTVEATSMAVPVIKGPAPLPTEEQAAE